MMRLLSILSISLLAFAWAGPASAQYGDYGKTRKSNATLAYEKAAKQAELNIETKAAAVEGCAANDAAACFQLGEHHRKGLAGTLNYKLAADAYEKSCDADNGEGCAGLAYLTTLGRGVSVNLPKSRKLYEKSCDLGEISGCAAYGNMLYTGTGGRKNTHTGTQLLHKACDADYEWACTRIVRLGAQERDANIDGRLRDMRSWR